MAYAAGYYTLTGIEYMKSKSLTVRGIGGTTGNTEGEITSTQSKSSSCRDFRGEQVRITPATESSLNGTSAQGDSGGLWYRPHAGGSPINIYAIGMLSEGTFDSEEVVCDEQLKFTSQVYPMYDLVENEGYTVGAGNKIIFHEPLPGFVLPPTNTGELDDKLYEDINGNGDGLDTEQTVKWFGELIRNPDGFDYLTDEQVAALDWNEDGHLSAGDAVALFGEQIRADSRSIYINGKPAEQATQEELHDILQKLSSGELSLEDLEE